jgi:hypothetical protein
MPYASERRYQVAISKSTQAIAEIVAAPGAGKRLAIDFITLNPSGGANNVTFTCSIVPVFALNDNQPLTFENAIHDPEGVLHCDSNQAFSLTLSAATLVEGFLTYRIIE